MFSQFRPGHLAENNRQGCPAPEVWGPYSMEEGKRQGYLATSRQYGNALLGVRHQEEEHGKVVRFGLIGMVATRGDGYICLTCS